MFPALVDLLAWLPGALVAAPLVALGALALFMLPGLALLRLLPLPVPVRPAQYLAAALALSWIVPPLLLLAADLLGLRWGPLATWAVLLLAALVVFWPRHKAAPARPWYDAELGLLLALWGLTLALRLYLVRELPAGLFGDSYHHTLITQLMVDNGGLFRSWQPYAPLATFTYHFGFHSMAAWLHWLTGYPVLRAVLLVGQVAAALAVPGVFLLTSQLFGERTIALWAALSVGLLSVFPTYYVNWGRYTQLAGQTVLPATCFVWMLLLQQARQPKLTWQRLAAPALLAVLATTGVALAHYRIGVFAACFVALYALYLLLMHVRSWLPALRMFFVAILVGSTGVVFTLPWLLRLREGRMLQLANHMVTTNIGATSGNAPSPIDLERTLANGMLPLALLGLLVLLLRRRWLALLLPLWLGIIWLAANPYLVGLTGAGIISSFAVIIAGYIWLAPLAGAGLAALVDGVGWLVGRVAAGRQAQAERFVIVLLATACILWGVGAQSNLLDPNFKLLTHADLHAAAWMREHLAPEAKVFVNSFPAYDAYVYAGTDGGWWLPLISGHRTNLPPMSYGFEAAEDPQFALLVMEYNQAILEHPLESAAAVAALRQWGYRYLYDGPAANPPVEHIDPARLADVPYYERIYDRDGVTIWRVR
ncbi:DUF6541 family protein [Candidatus Viridilinea mediisalina]|uniref:Glycosyltransferase RgtA/B/C/D-like domain-containing protein n=1 Tax=Candidatus Viridilinea mediisalina TaxID=2024553 RepID=A0A2A6RLU2_9CHLR|nr:DUF6541 family protein [Candidatus Viridilinea mediisalina]PDW03895.1 hypothetical protein CJ255_06485 [Candidatus Viridilinea mediisalina]